MLLAGLALLTVAVAACGTEMSADGSSRAANSLSGAEAAGMVVVNLDERFFTDEVGIVHPCSSYVDTLLMSSWEPDTESWMLTFTGGYERGTLVFRYFESAPGFVHVAGPKLAPDCGVTEADF